MSVYAERARFVPVEQGFNIQRPAIEPCAFVAEMHRVLADDAGTGFVALDMSARLGTAGPATTPFMLARYARIRAGERLRCAWSASGEIWAVLGGSGRLVRDDAVLAWAAGDVIALPGGAASEWSADRDAVLWVATDEPLLAFAGVRPPLGALGPIEPTQYRAADIEAALRPLYDRPLGPETAGRAIFMASARTEALGTCVPSMTLTLNAVRPGEAQRPHRHNAAALVLALREAGCTSTIGDQVFPWTRHVTLLTPAGAIHRHRNGLATSGPVREQDIALALIVQDGGLYYHGRTMGFAFG